MIIFSMTYLERLAFDALFLEGGHIHRPPINLLSVPPQSLLGQQLKIENNRTRFTGHFHNKQTFLRESTHIFDYLHTVEEIVHFVENLYLCSLITAYCKQGNSVARDLPQTGSETNTTIFVIYILDIDSHCPYLLSGETTFQLTSC